MSEWREPDWMQQRRARYPEIFAQPCMLACGEGWANLLDVLCEALQAQTRRGAPQLIAAQIKEKHGGLRFYVEPAYAAAQARKCRRNGR